MKKNILKLLFLLMIITTIGCGKTKENTVKKENEAVEKEEVTEKVSKKEEANQVQEEIFVEAKIVALKGPTAMGMVDLMNKSDSGVYEETDYKFNIVAAVDEVAPLLVKKEADIAAVPANLAAVLYNNTEGQIQVLAVNTLGVLYLAGVGEETVTVEDLKGKTIFASGKGATPEYALNYILTQNGIDIEKEVDIQWKSEHTECLTSLLAKEDSVALLPQPFVTTAQMKNENIKIIMDLNEEWEKLQDADSEKSALLTGVIVARKEFIENNTEAVKDFLKKYEESVLYVNNNVEEAAKLVGKYDIVPKEVAVKAIPECNITYIDGEEMKEKLSGYLKVLFAQNPKAVGGKLPQEDFYFIQ